LILKEHHVDRQERIDALQKALAAIETAVAQSQTLRQTKFDPDAVQQLTSQLAELAEVQAALKARLANLQMAGEEIVTISPDNASHIRALSADLERAIVDPSAFAFTFNFVSAVSGKVSALLNALPGNDDWPFPIRR
jgi:hypothetical protein